jgi:hypothetical protein
VRVERAADYESFGKLLPHPTLEKLQTHSLER